MPQRSRKASSATNDPNFMQSLARGLDVIGAFQHARPSLTVSEVAAVANMSRAAARRCLHTLSVLGYARGVDGSYRLTPKALSLGYAYLNASPVARVAQPVLEEVSTRLHESCSMTVLDGDEIVYVARAATQRIISVGLAVGSRLPAYCTAMGRVLLAFSNEADLDAYLQRVPLNRQTPHTITELAVLRRELQRVRTVGYALVDQELELGLRSIAVPVRQSDGRAVAAINVGAQAARVDLETMTRSYLPILREAADQIALSVTR
ncbi:MAG TPA: IclR family transcriptional regulator C-terminal domain-containing protein [Vicinamibacterales bacterium]